jgi:histidine triad (HIT) family protein
MTDTAKGQCIFCRIAGGELRCDKLFEDERVLAFRDVHPLAPVHGLVIPKQHVATLDDFGNDDEALLGRLLLVARQIAKEHGLPGYRVVMNVNSAGGQTVFHAHLHILGGRQLGRLG